MAESNAKGTASAMVAGAAGESLSAMILGGARASEIAARLDALPRERRIAEVCTLGFRAQAKLWETVKGFGALELNTFVDPVGQTIIYEGKNSLPLFTRFQKRFFRPEAGDVVGYNHNGAFLSALTGPGYFTTYAGPNGELVLDYTRVPTLRPEGWPPIAPNKGLIAGNVYGGMLDYVRYVAQGTVIGAAFRGDKPRNAYFMLTRSA